MVRLLGFLRKAAQNRLRTGTTASASNWLKGVFFRFLPGLAVAVTLIFTQGLGATPSQAADWLVTISDGGSDPVGAGRTIYYSVNVLNDDVDTAPATTLSLAIPAGLTFVGGDAADTISDCAPNPAPGSAAVTCNVPAIPGGTTVKLTAAVKASTAVTLSTTYTVTASVPDQVNVPPLVVDRNPANNSASENTTVNPGTDISVSVSGPATLQSGAAASYVFTVGNLGPAVASNVTVLLQKPTGLDGIATPSGCTLSGTVYTCTIAGSMPVNGTATLTLSGRISAASGATVTANGNYASSSPADSDGSNNSASLDTSVTAGTFLSINKSATPATTVYLGDTVTFTLDPRYTGDVPSSVTLTDAVPSNFQITSATGSGWSCAISGQNVSCTRAGGSSAGYNVSLQNISIKTQVVSVTPATPANTAMLSAASPPNNGPNVPSNSVTVTIGADSADLEPINTAPSPATAQVGDTVNFVLNAKNNGTRPFVGTITLTEEIPAGMEKWSSAITPSGWTCSPSGIVVGPSTAFTCSRTYTSGSPLAVGASTGSIITLGMRLTAAATLNNCVTLSATGTAWPEPTGNNRVCSPISVVPAGGGADIKVTKTARLASVPVYDIQTFDIEVSNPSTTTSTNLSLTDRLTDLYNDFYGPTAGTVSVSTSAGVATGVSCSTAAGPTSTTRDLTCTIASLPNCTAGSNCPIITVQVRPGGKSAATSRSNTATVTARDVYDPDTTNNTSTVSYTVTPRANLRAVKYFSPNTTPSTVFVGQELKYWVNVAADAGYSNASGVQFTDQLPSNLRFVSASITAGTGTCTTPAAGSVTSLTNNMIQCSLGTLNANNNTYSTVTIFVQPLLATSALTIFNNASVTTTTAETTTADNSSTVSTYIQPPSSDLMVEKFVSADPVGIGTTAVYTLRLKNNGPSEATAIELTDTLPSSGLSFVSLGTLPSGVTCSTVPATGSIGGQLKCAMSVLNAADSRDITVTMKGETKGTVTNTLTATSAESRAGYDPNTANNTVSLNTSVATRVDLAVVEKSSPTGRNITINDPFNWTIRVTNNPTLLTAADDVQLSDTLPAGMELTGTPTATVTAGTTTINNCTGTAGATSFVCSFGTLSPAGAITITAPVRVTAVTSSPQTFSNTATVSTSSIEMAPSNDSRTGTVSIRTTNISGRVFRDNDNDGIFSTGDSGVSGVVITATGVAADGTPVTASASTDANGYYNIPGLPRGTYSVQRSAISEPNYVDGQAIPNPVIGGTAVNATTITGINVSASSATPYNFTILPTPQIALAKKLGQYKIDADGVVEGTFSLIAQNIGPGTLSNIVFSDQLAGAFTQFGTYTSGPITPGTYSATADDVGNCIGATINSGFNGASDTVVASVSSLAPTALCEVGITVRFHPDTAEIAEILSGNPYYNQASVTADGYVGMTTSDLSNNGDVPEPGKNDPTPFLPDITPDAGLLKPVGTYQDLNGNGPDPGDTITYEFTVYNPSVVVPIINIAVTDPKVQNIVCGRTTLYYTDTTFCAGDPYVLTAADIAAGQVVNQATLTFNTPYQGPFSDLSDPTAFGGAHNDPTITPLPPVARLGIAKAVTSNADEDGSGTITPGDTLTYTVTATNTGTLAQTNVVVTDSLITPNSNVCATLAPGATCVLAGTYKVVTADADAGQIVNTAEAVSTEVPIKVTATLTTPVAQTRSLGIDKVVDNAGPVNVGDTLGYTVTVTNTGNATQTNVVVTDSLLSPASQTCATLAPNATCVLTGSYVVQASDADAGKVDNTASAVSTEVTTPVTDSVSVPVTQTRSLSIDKVVDKTGPVNVGDTLGYTVTVTNTGNATQTNVVVTDSLLSPASQTCATLAPNATCVLTGSYVVQASDANAGKVDNTASAVSTEVTTAVTDSTSTPVTQTRSLSIDKVVDKTGPVNVGDTLGYTVTVTNTGNATQTNVVVTDSLLSPASQTCATLAPNATCVLTGSYVVQASDADAGKVDNTASAVSTEVTTAVTDSTSTPVTQTRSLSIDKVVDKTGPVNVGDTLGYTVTVTNTGNATQTNVVVTDSLLSPASQTCATLAPNATCVLTGSYVVQASDANAGKVDNTASAVSTEVTTPVTDSTSTPVTQTRSLSIDKVVDKTGPVNVGDTLGYRVTVTNTGNTSQTNVVVTDSLLSPASQTCATLAPNATCVLTGSYVVQSSDANTGKVDNTASAVSTEVTTAVTDSTSTPVTQTRSLSIDKVVDKTGPVNVGDTLGYTVTVTNTGNATQTNVVVTDSLLSPASQTCATLAPNATCVLTGSYVVQASDANAGKVDNTASAVSTEVTTPVTDSVSVPVTQTRSLSIDKVVDNAGPVNVGDTLGYRVTVTNTGNATQTNVVVTDSLLSPASQTCATLAPNATCVLTGSYVVQASDANAGKVDNTASAVSTEVTTPVTDSVSVPVQRNGEMNSLSKTALVSTVRRGEKVPYVIEAQNVSVSPARIVDVIPVGFDYVPGSASVNGSKVAPDVDGRRLTFDGLKPNNQGVIMLKLTLVATAAVQPGDALNRAQLIDPQGGSVLADARARVTVLYEAVFDCGGVIGKVFDDKNRNGYQDEGERGLPAVRIATVRGLLVTTDEHGRFHIACADMPDAEIGTNFVMKLDTRTLPAGYHVTSENPRRVRLTAGKVVKLNFGAALTRLVKLDLNDKVFEEGASTLKPKWQAGLGQLIVALAAEPSVLKVTYYGKGDKLAKARVQAITRDIKKRWQSQGPPYALDIETRLVAAGGEGGQ